MYNRYQVCTSTCCCKHKTDAENKVVCVCVCCVCVYILRAHVPVCKSESDPHYDLEFIPTITTPAVLEKRFFWSTKISERTHILANNNHIPSKVQPETLIALLSFYTHSNTHMHKQRYICWHSGRVSGYRHDYLLVSQSVLTIYTGSCPVGAAVAGPNESWSYSGYSVVCIKPNEEGRTSSLSVRMGYTEWP